MEMLDHIKARRTIRKFKPDPVPQEVIDDVFEAAMWAPSHGNAQPWDFVVVGAETRGRLLALLQAKAKELLATPGMPPKKRENIEALVDDFGGAPYMVAVLSHPGADPLEAVENPPRGGGCPPRTCAWPPGPTTWARCGSRSAPPRRRSRSSASPRAARSSRCSPLATPAEIPSPPPREDYRTHLRVLS